MNPSPKAKASAGGGGLGFAVATLVVWVLTANGIDVPEPVATAIGGIVAAALAYAGAYLGRNYDPRHD